MLDRDKQIFKKLAKVNFVLFLIDVYFRALSKKFTNFSIRLLFIFYLLFSYRMLIFCPLVC